MSKLSFVNSVSSASFITERTALAKEVQTREKIHNKLIYYWKEYSLFNNYKILIGKNDEGERYYSALDLFDNKPITQLRNWIKTNLDLELLEHSIAL